MRFAYKKVMRDFKEYILQASFDEDDVVFEDDKFVNVKKATCLSVLNFPHSGNAGLPTLQTKFYSLYDWNFVYNLGEEAKSCGRGIFLCRRLEDAQNFMKRAEDFRSERIDAILPTGFDTVVFGTPETGMTIHVVRTYEPSF